MISQLASARPVISLPSSAKAGEITGETVTSAVGTGW